jgi:hypothetical protein
MSSITVVVTIAAQIKSPILASITPYCGAHTLNTRAFGSPWISAISISGIERCVCSSALALTKSVFHVFSMSPYRYFYPPIGRQVVIIERLRAQMRDRANLSRYGAISLLLELLEVVW